jgi:hypothetical protein
VCVSVVAAVTGVTGCTASSVVEVVVTVRRSPAQPGRKVHAIALMERIRMSFIFVDNVK